MPERCPHCEEVCESRWLRRAAVRYTGDPWYYAILAPYVRGYYCPKHGEIPPHDLSPAARRSNRLMTIGFVVGVFFVVGLLVVLLAAWLV